MNYALRKLRARQMLTQQDLASKAGITITTLYRLENAKTRARPRTVRALANALGIEPTELRRILEEHTE